MIQRGSVHDWLAFQPGAQAGAIVARRREAIFIYLLMGFLFESFILPLSIISTIPLAGIGVDWIHYALSYNLDFLGVVGIVLLIGVVVNSGIVLIDYASRLRAEGLAQLVTGRAIRHALGTSPAERAEV